MSSTRLPGKVMRPLADKTVLGQVIDRLQRSRRLDAVIIATSTEPEDAPIHAEALHAGALAFRGDLLNVLSRYYHAAREQQLDVVVRITSDCPLIDWEILDQMLAVFHAGLAGPNPPDYLSNSRVRRYPRGLDCEIFTFAGLERCYWSATQDYEREHVTPYFYQHPELFRLEDFIAPEDHSSLRWTLDTDADLRLIQTIYERLYRPGQPPLTAAILQLFENEPELAWINAQVQQKGLHG